MGDLHEANAVQPPDAPSMYEEDCDDVPEHNDAASTTSTVAFDHETFETFKKKVLKLCQDLWSLKADAFQIIRMEGGGYNRVIGITTTPPAKEPTTLQRWVNQIRKLFSLKPKHILSQPQEFVIRIPRSEHA